MIIDFHTHIFPSRLIKNRQKYIDSDACFAILYSSPKARLATAEQLIASMDEEEIDISVVLNLGWTTHELCVETNEYILESITRYPKRLIGFCAVQPLSLEAALKEIDRCAGAGARGIGEMRPDMQLIDFREEEIMKPLVELMIKHKLVLLTHASEPVGHEYKGKGAVTPEVLYPLITGYPELPLVCAHWGGGLPFYALMPEVNKAMANVFFDTAASPFLYSPRIYEQVAQLTGADKILFGSDYPLLPQRRLLDEIEALGLPEDKKQLILSGNAEKLLGI
jgi:predicted TIM-barrel fold metal-dependent hydrolase